MPLKPSYLILTGAGAIVAYSGLKGKGIASVTREVISGQSPAKGNVQTSAMITSAGGIDSSAGDGNTPPPGDTSAQTGNAKRNQIVGRLLAIPYGWGHGQEWQDLVSLWNQESGWNQYADNPQSDAEGIPQALPYSKMPQSAWLPRHGGIASVYAQIRWGLAYIKSTYGSPSAAWAHEVANNWY